MLLLPIPWASVPMPTLLPRIQWASVLRLMLEWHFSNYNTGAYEGRGTTERWAKLSR